MFKKLSVALELLKVGRRLNNPIPWKNAQALTGLLIAIVPVGIKAINTFTGIDIDITNDQISEGATMAAGALVSIYGLYSWFTTVATTNKIGGLPHKSKS